MIFSQNLLSSFTRTRATQRTQKTIMSTETRREIYHTTMEISAPKRNKQQDPEPKTVMATVEIAYEEGHQDGYQEGWENCNRDIHDVVAQESYDDGVMEGRALAADEISILRQQLEEQQAEKEALRIQLEEQQVQIAADQEEISVLIDKIQAMNAIWEREIEGKRDSLNSEAKARF